MKGGEPGGRGDPADEAGQGDPVLAAVEEAGRHEWAFVLAATARVAGDLDLAEECVQEAFGAALTTWRRDGVPRRPGAWLTTTARRRALDVLRRDRTLRAKLPLLVDPAPYDDPPYGDATGDGGSIPDDRLRLVFVCCHPALAREAQVALTLRLVCGLTTAEIAAAFLVPEATMAARVTRAKKKIAAARIPYRVPDSTELPERLDAVLTVIHLLFTTGYVAPAGDRLVQPELVARALDLARLLRLLMPDEAEVRGLLGLVLATDARRATRTAADGRLQLLEEQDRSRWDRAMIDEASELVAGALRGGHRGRFALQGGIAVLHAAAPAYDATDWPQVLRLYDELLAAWPSPVVALNRAAVLAKVAGAAAALEAVDELARDGALEGYRYLPATRAALLRELGRRTEAAAAYRAALALADNAAERDFLSARLAEVGG